MSMMYPGFGFNLMSVLFPAMFLLVFAIVALTILRELLQWNKNNHAPRLIVDAQVVSRRTNVSRRRGANDVANRTSTTYYVTFQFETGDRMELRLQGHEYGLLVEGDKGKLTFQGTRYLGFERM
jgi:hypothetical protein